MSSKDFTSAMCNDDGSIKRSLIEAMDKYFSDKDAEEKAYLRDHFERDKDIARAYLMDPDHKGISTDHDSKIGITDLQLFGSCLFHNSGSIGLPVPHGEHYTFTAGIRVFEDFEIELVVGQGSFFWVTLHDATLHFGEGI